MQTRRSIGTRTCGRSTRCSRANATTPRFAAGRGRSCASTIGRLKRCSPSKLSCRARLRLHGVALAHRRRRERARSPGHLRRRLPGDPRPRPAHLHPLQLRAAVRAGPALPQQAAALDLPVAPLQRRPGDAAALRRRRVGDRASMESGVRGHLVRLEGPANALTPQHRAIDQDEHPALRAGLCADNAARRRPDADRLERAARCVVSGAPPSSALERTRRSCSRSRSSSSHLSPT